jgi:peptidoglycan/xylan/chitin deacetylase (PgdA/CDA1 family)
VVRPLLVFVVAFGLAVPGVISAAADVTDAPASPPASASLLAAPLAPATIVPTASPSPGDVTPPVTTAVGMGSRWRNDTAVVRLAATDAESGVAATVYRVDDGTWQVGTEVRVRALKDHSNDGEHVVAFYSVDNALNEEMPPKTVTVKIDTRPPHFAWTSVSPGIIRRIEPVTFRFTLDERSGPVTLSYKVADQYGYPAVGKSGLERTPGTRSVELVPRYRSHKGFVPGVYRMQVRVRDEAGNVTVSNRRSFRNSRPMSGGVWYRVGGVGRRVALTFDDGGAGPWASILSTLKRHKAHATFFPLGAYAAASPGLMRRTVQEGNAVGTHGWTHSLMTRQSASQIQSEWLRATAPWWGATGYSPAPYCRPPYGDINGSVTAASAAIGYYRVILWDVDPRDWSQPAPGVITSRVLSAVHPGAIVCLHLMPQTAQALPSILSGLGARGYKAVSLPEMFHAAGLH